MLFGCVVYKDLKLGASGSLLNRQGISRPQELSVTHVLSRPSVVSTKFCHYEG